MTWVKIVTILIAVASMSKLSSAQPRVSRSFVRGFLVGYAKGLQEGRQQPVIHQVACAFHPVHPEPLHEPILNDIIEPMHMHPEPEHHEQGGFSSNNHVTHTAQGSGMHHPNEGRIVGGGGGHHHHDHHHGDKKAAATNEISVGHMQKLAPPLTPTTIITNLNSFQPRSSVSVQTTEESAASGKSSAKKKATTSGSGH